MSETLYRALNIGDAVGRTLSGLAMPWDRPERVRDLTGGPYTEAFSPSSADVSIRQHRSFPVFSMHSYLFDPTSEPFGVVTFQRSAEGLIYEAPLSRTVRGDEMLELVNDGAMRSVSIGFKPLQSVRGRMIGGAPVDQYRTEVALKELSLAPTGFGQYADAGVSSVRSESGEDPGALMQAVDAALDAASDALLAGNLDQGLALVTAAEVAIDALLALFNIEDADEPDEMATAAQARMVGLQEMAAYRLRMRSIAARPAPLIF